MTWDASLLRPSQTLFGCEAPESDASPTFFFPACVLLTAPFMFWNWANPDSPATPSCSMVRTPCAIPGAAIHSPRRPDSLAGEAGWQHPGACGGSSARGGLRSAQEVGRRGKSSSDLPRTPLLGISSGFPAYDSLGARACSPTADAPAARGYQDFLPQVLAQTRAGNSIWQGFSYPEGPGVCGFAWRCSALSFPAKITALGGCCWGERQHGGLLWSCPPNSWRPRIQVCPLPCVFLTPPARHSARQEQRGEDRRGGEVLALLVRC